MVRTPCCEKIGLKKGTWTPEEDKKLVDYVTRYGHWNWRLLPEFAGLERCGKSCRLRWLNYLRPNLKRGGYTSEEEETIIKLNGLLGNRWSAIAAQMPGRTDNEIKNHWHTNLKKRLQRNSVTKAKDSKSKEQSSVETVNNIVGSTNNLITTQLSDSCSFSHHSSSTKSSSTNTESSVITRNENMVSEDGFSFLDADMSLMIENFWLELEPYELDISSIPNETEYFGTIFDLELWNHDS